MIRNRKALALGLAAVLTALALAGCTPTKGTGGGSGGGGGAIPAPFIPGGATLVVETYDLKTLAHIPANERDYPLKVTIQVLNHDNEQAIGFPQHVLVTHNPWEHTVEWPQVDQFDRAEADIIVPHGLVAGVGVACRWLSLKGIPYANTSELAVRGGGPGGVDGMQCIITAAVLGRG